MGTAIRYRVVDVLLRPCQKITGRYLYQSTTVPVPHNPDYFILFHCVSIPIGSSLYISLQRLLDDAAMVVAVSHFGGTVFLGSSYGAILFMCRLQQW
ncbi:hypothetical protein P152DRAFT_67459 [Eremomyces bilateralis CBS 781.70]|uniref:Uncharacterized protein n=1 Tax=Eremomyces bilateralis CBS 781.70 TaxID=1392243 RepID=A0A6G1FZJ8_9PEZI|nr:uncharacterized protein P152DRAFT_67459 [Eremomyces bilateralis CBS 781.70]KAF1811277.1 hypothetical protein P152DRAFT_67459 [Eremomyces bilateralis CBS 781.70]